MTKITFQLPIYTFQIDFIGHVNNAIYVQWMEIGRTKLLDGIGMSIDKIAQNGIVPVLVSTEIKYIQPLHLGDQVRVEMWLSELRRASAWIEFRFYNQNEKLVASAKQLGLFVDTATNRPHRLSKEDRELFEQFVHQEE